MIQAQPPALVYHEPSGFPSAAAQETQATRDTLGDADGQAPSAVDRSKYFFTHPWFDAVRGNWEQLTAPLKNKPLRILEVGCFEGSSTTWIMDNLLEHPSSTLTAVDWFEGSVEHAGPAFELSGLERRFLANVDKARHPEKLRVLVGRSADRLTQLRTEEAVFDFIYIDASHVALDVLQDAALSWSMLRPGGTLVFDDYDWGPDRPEYDSPKIAIDAFLRCAGPGLVWFERGGQIWATKTQG